MEAKGLMGSDQKRDGLSKQKVTLSAKAGTRKQMLIGDGCR